MLYEIRCDKFMSNGKHRPPIRFHKGLNTILGGKSADNSIGKSTFLLIIDYVFGGDTYKTSDAVQHLGNHLIMFAFKFGDMIHYFSRDIVNGSEVNICNASYEIQKTISIDEYRDFLFKSYCIDLPYITFRDVVGRYLRVYGKGNHSSTRPLESYRGEKAESSIIALEKLFNSYWKIEQYKTALSKKMEMQKFYRQGRKVEFVPFSTKTQAQFKSNIAEIQQLEKQLAQLVEETDHSLSTNELLHTDRASEIRGKITALKRQRSKLKSQLEIVNVSINGGFTHNVADLAELAQFFPNVNMQKLAEVENFHGKMQRILSLELNEEAQRLQVLISSLNEEISSLESELRLLGIPTKVPKTFLDSYSIIRNRIIDLEKQNQAYLDSKNLVAEVKTAKANLLEAQETELRHIESAINEQMVRYNDIIYKGMRKAPVIDLADGTKYFFWTPDDSGTGTSYKSLIVFDLSILKLTQLPAVAHDSLIFKNIADAPIDQIIKLYAESTKQIFISFDKDISYSEETSKTLHATSVLQLSSGGNELFGYFWGDTRR